MKKHIQVLESMLTMMFSSIQKDIDDMFMKRLENEMTKPVYDWCPVGKCACAKKVGDTCTFGDKVRLLAMMKKCADREERK